ncbi:MAG: penicillin-binding protein 2 [Chloroflexi bacterium RBG_13_56_8]|nr:MAG: penicillin-binding protein 2 [Chloroflexi bacterium RBG_13_56_8]
MSAERYARVRFTIFRLIVSVAFAILAFKLWQLQIVSSQTFQRSADRNRFRLVPIDAPRGIIYDRFGRMLVRNVPSFVVSVVPAGLPEDPVARREVLQRVGQLLDMPVGVAEDEEAALTSIDSPEELSPLQEVPTIEGILKERFAGPYEPVRIATNVDRQAAFILEEEHLELPGIVVEAKPQRYYEDGPLTSHVLGYMGYIPSDDLESYINDEESEYQPNDWVGLTGIELTQEETLHGKKGQKHIEVDAFEREVAVIASQPAEQGHNLMLTLDLELQRAVADILHEGMRTAGSATGVVVAMDPRTGEILAMVSLPSYDNNLFAGSISYEDYARLSSDKDRPLVNHAISGQYPPGSTFKIVPASAALEEHVIDRSTTFVCQGTFLLPNKYFPDDPTKAQKFYCWNEWGHGSLNIVGGIMQSCDIFFYQVTGGYPGFAGLGVERLAEYASMFGFGQPTGIELSGEAGGLVPSDQWKRQTYGENWVTGDTYNASIGQGYVLATPLQVLNATAAIANGGTLYRPQLVYQVIDAEGQVVRSLEPGVIRELAVSDEYLALVRLGMLEAVNRGTAWLAQLPGIEVAGKTGTAEYSAFDEEGNLIVDEKGNLPTHAWFTAFAPYEDPEIALVVFLEGGGEGSQRAVPIAAKILRHYFGLPDPAPTIAPNAVSGGE